MNARRAVVLALAALVVAGSAVWVQMRNAAQTAAPPAALVLAGLADSLDTVSEVRLARGDGIATTMQRQAGSGAGWMVTQRGYAVDEVKLRKLLLDLSTLRAIEEKTSDPARYAVLDVQDATGADSHAVRIDVVAGSRTWTLLVGKAAQPSGTYVRVPPAPAAWLVQPPIGADPEPARWIETALVDVQASRVQQVSVRPAEGPAYTLSREHPETADFKLKPVPPGRKPAGSAVLNAAASNLAQLHADDVQAPPATLPPHASHASVRTFDGLVLDLDGHRDGTRAWVRVHAGGTDAAAAAAINARLDGRDFELAAYKFDAIFRPLDALLELRSKSSSGTGRPKK